MLTARKRPISVFPGRGMGHGDPWSMVSEWGGPPSQWDRSWDMARRILEMGVRSP